MLKAVRPVVVGLLLWTAYTVAYPVFGVKTAGWGSGLIHNWDKLLISAAAFGLLTLTEVNPVWLVIAGAILGYLIYR
jgi:hypothetical protein